MIYLLTYSDDYYPAAGTRDWLSMHPTLEEAEREFGRIDKDMGGSACLIEIDPDECSWALLDFA